MSDVNIMLAFFVDNVAVGTKFKKWPLHVSVIPWFKCNNTQKFYTQLKSIWHETGQIDYEIKDIEYYGKKQNIKVSSLKHSQELYDLHNTLLKLAQDYDSKMDVKYCGENYTPHITHKKDTNPPIKGETGIFNKIYVVMDLDSKQMIREVVKCF